MNIKEKVKELEATYYWDAKAFDLQISYFGDEITLIYEDEGDKCWKVTFIICGKVEYDNNALWSQSRGEKQVKDMHRAALGYWLTDIDLKPYSEHEGFVECTVQFSGNMTMKIVCRDIHVEHCNLSDFHFFWQDNSDKNDKH